MRVLTWITSLLVLVSCAHGPTPRDKKEAKALYSGAKALLEEDLYRDALQDLHKAEELDPKEPKIQYLLGVVYFTGFGRTQSAEEHLLKALAHDENKERIPKIHNLFGAVLIEAGRYPQAIEHLQKAQQDILYRTPQFAEQNLGLAYSRLGNNPSALKHYLRALEQDPNLCGAYPQLAEVYKDLGKIDTSIKTLEEFFNHCRNNDLVSHVPKPLFASSLYRLGMYRLKNGDDVAAKRAFSECIESYPEIKIADECAKSLKLLQ